MATLLGAALLLAAAEAAHPASAFVDQWQQALRSGAKDAVLAGLAPDAIIFESGGAEMSRDEYAHHHLGSDMEFAGATTTTVQSRNVVEAGNAVAVLSRTATSGTFRGQPVSSRGAETILLERSGETWRIRHVHWSSARDEGAPAAAELTARSLAAKLRAAKLVVKERPPVEQPFFRPRARVLVVGDDELQVFEFATVKEAEEAAATVDATGSTIGTSTPRWMAPPHFYRKGRLVVIHLGQGPDLTAALKKNLGPAFAERR